MTVSLLALCYLMPLLSTVSCLLHRTYRKQDIWYSAQYILFLFKVIVHLELYFRHVFMSS